jgi:hypothetical protein
MKSYIHRNLASGQERDKMQGIKQTLFGSDVRYDEDEIPENL